jgi:hypothetical protein
MNIINNIDGGETFDESIVNLINMISQNDQIESISEPTDLLYTILMENVDSDTNTVNDTNILNNKLNLNTNSNNKIMSDFILFIHDKITNSFLQNNFAKINAQNIVNHILDHIMNNLYKTDDFIDLQVLIINSIYVYIINKYGLSLFPDIEILNSTYKYENDDLLSDPIFLKLINSIQFNNSLYIYFLKLISNIDNVELFKYIYNKSIIDGYNIDLTNIIDYIAGNKKNTHTQINDDIIKIDIFGTIRCLRIFKYILNNISDNKKRIQLVGNFYENIFKLKNAVSSSNEIFIDNNIEYLVIHINPNETYDNCLIYTYFKLEEINNYSDQIIKSIIYSKFSSITIIKDVLIFFNKNIYDYIYEIFKSNNKYAQYLIKTKDITKSNYRINNTLLELSKIHIWSIAKYLLSNRWKLINTLINKITNIYNLAKLSNDQINNIFYMATKYNNLIIIKKLFKHYYYINDHSQIINLLKYCTNLNTIKLILKLMKKYVYTFDFNNQDIIYVYLKNTNLLCCLLKNKILNNNISNIIFDLIVHKNIKISNINKTIQLLINNINFEYDNNIANFMYKNNYRGALCDYLSKTYYQHNMTYNTIKQKYKKIINTREFPILMLKLQINVENAHEILKLTSRSWYRTKLKHIIINVIGLDIHNF